MPKSPLTGDDADNNITDRDSILRASIEIEPEDLNEEFIKAPGQISYWNQAYAEAHKQHALAKLEYDRAWAQLYCSLRAEYEGRKPAVTVDALKALVEQDEDLYHLQMQVVLADAERLRMRGVAEAVIAKKDMLQSLGAKLREELRGDPTLRNNALTG